MFLSYLGCSSNIPTVNREKLSGGGGKHFFWAKYSPFHKTLPNLKLQMLWISVSFNEMGVIYPWL